MHDHRRRRTAAELAQQLGQRAEAAQILGGTHGSHEMVVVMERDTRRTSRFVVEYSPATRDEVHVEIAPSEVATEEERDLLCAAELELGDDVDDRGARHGHAVARAAAICPCQSASSIAEYSQAP